MQVRFSHDQGRLKCRLSYSFVEPTYEARAQNPSLLQWFWELPRPQLRKPPLGGPRLSREQFLMVVMLIDAGVLQQPLLELSSLFKQHRNRNDECRMGLDARTT
ncbi:hypothetical protein [Synechococcus sp. WH 5701]|uniref:hypothetical protein n=1 Tax=Synechococcus sp. WH 5701 TaxID=69042 RepID=UPI0012E9F750|nr:hypothetical protein [Synechococcus sp. WH 5701]